MDKQSQIENLIREYNSVQKEIEIAFKKGINKTNRILWLEMTHRRASYEKTLLTKFNYNGILEPYVEDKKRAKHKPNTEAPPSNSTHINSKPQLNTVTTPVSEAPNATTCKALKEADNEKRKEVVLAGESFFLSYTDKAHKRRQDAFLSNDPLECLTDSEKKILSKLNITGENITTLKPYLADFFKSLPNCQSTAQMMTSKKCEIPNYIMSTLLLKARYDVQKHMDKGKTTSLGDIETLQKNAQIKAIKEVGYGNKSTFGTMFSKQSYCNETDCKKIAEGISRIETLLKTNVSGSKMTNTTESK